VLIVGGLGGEPPNNISSAELYLPGSRTFTTTIGAPIVARHFHTATLLNDGRVLVVGGWGSNGGAESAEIYDPTLGTFARTATTVGTFRTHHTATRLGDGRVLIAGGINTAESPDAASTANLFDPAGETFILAGTLKTPRVDHTATLLGDGSVLLTGGRDEAQALVCCPAVTSLASRERFVAGVGFIGAGSSLVSRTSHAATLVTGGRVLITGGYGYSFGGGRSFEFYVPATAVGIANPNPPDGSTNTAYAPFVLTGTGGSGGPYSITHRSGQLPPGLVYDESARQITGTPTEAGTFTAAFAVVDTGLHSGVETLTFHIDRLMITTTTLPDATKGSPYVGPLTATGRSPFTWALGFGSLPPGLTIAGDAITGTPTATGFFNFSVRAVDSLGQATYRGLSINVLAAPTAPPPNTAPTPLVNRTGPGTAMVSFFNPAPTGNPADVPGNGSLASVSFFNPAPVTPTQPPAQSSGVAPSVSFFNPAPATQTQPPAESSGVARSVSFFNPAPVTQTQPPAESSGVARSVSFFNPAATPAPTQTTSSGVAAPVSFFNPEAVAQPPSVTASAAAAPAVSFVNGQDPSVAAAAAAARNAGASLGVLTFAAGPTITSVSPGQLSASSSTPLTLVLTGANLGNVTLINLSDSTGITLGVFTIAFDGTSISIPVTLAPTTGIRTVTISVAGPDGESPVTAATVFTIVP